MRLMRSENLLIGVLSLVLFVGTLGLIGYAWWRDAYYRCVVTKMVFVEDHTDTTIISTDPYMTVDNYVPAHWETECVDWERK